MDNKEKIARRAAQFLKDGDLVNLGIGIPTLVGNYVDPDVEVTLQSENGFIGLGPMPEPGKEEKDVVNAGGHPVTILTGGSCFDSCMSFALIRGGHVSSTILGAFEVDQEGSIANWMVPGKKVPGMGGAMDLLVQKCDHYHGTYNQGRTSENPQKMQSAVDRDACCGLCRNGTLCSAFYRRRLGHRGAG